MLTRRTNLTIQPPDFHVTRKSGLGKAVRPTDDVGAFSRLSKQIRERRPRILHTRAAKAGALGRAAARVAGTRPIISHTCHGHVLSGYFTSP